MKPLLVAVSLALAFLAIPSAAAEEPTPPEVPGKVVQCTYPNGDTDCVAEAGPCKAHTHQYDVEDALNVYEASCYDCGIQIGGGPFIQCPLIGPTTTAAAPAPPIQTHCWAMPDGTGCRTTFQLGPATCGYTSGNWDGFQHAAIDCSTAETGYCYVGILPPQSPPSIGCEDYGPAEESSAAQPCTSGVALSCTVTAGPCSVAAGASLIVTTAVGAAADCTLGYTDCHAGAGVGQMLLPPPQPDVYCSLTTASASAAEVPPQPCTAGFAQTWCDFTVGPCDVRVVPWTAWGDRYVVSDCQGGGAGPTCHTEVHTLPPDHTHYCAFASAPLATCLDLVMPQVGFDCEPAPGVRCMFSIWLDLNPPNPSMACPA